MSKSHRNLMKRQIGEAYQDLVRATSHIAAVGSEFSGVHPEIENVLILCVQGIDQIENLLRAFCYEAWGIEQSDFMNWINTGQDYRQQKELEEFLQDEETRNMLLNAMGDDTSIERE